LTSSVAGSFWKVRRGVVFSEVSRYFRTCLFFKRAFHTMTKRGLLLIIGLMYFILPGFSQKPDSRALQKIREEGLNNSQVERIAHQLTDVAGSRLTNSPGFQRAADWSISQLTAWGLKNARLEEWGEFGKGWQFEKSYLAMTSPYYMPFIAIPKAWTGSTPGPVEGKVVVVELNSEEDFSQYAGKLRDKIVLVKGESFDAGPTFKPDAIRHTAEDLEKLTNSETFGGQRFTPEMLERYRSMRNFRTKIDSFLVAEGIRLELIRRNGRHGTLFTSNGAPYQAGTPEAGPAFELANEHAGLVQRLLESGVEVTLEAEIKTRFFTDRTKASNVIAEIPGSDRRLGEEIVMLGAHLDSWHGATGATDNAAGSIVMLEAVRILQAAGLKPRRTIRIALWSGEEQGIHGSRNFVKKHYGEAESMKLHPDHEKFSAYYNIDNGTGRIRGVYLQGNEAVRPIFKQWLEPFSDIIDTPTLTSRNTGGTDHLSFDAVGLPGFQFIQDGVEYGSRTHHTNQDLYERLVMDDLKQMAVVVAAFVYNTAQMDGKIPRKELPKPSSGR
jgi:carboxypeptidase Q